MAKPKRVSMKGQGAALFFDGTPDLPEASTDADEVMPDTSTELSPRAEPAHATMQQSVRATNKARTLQTSSGPRRRTRVEDRQSPAVGAANPVADVALDTMWSAVAMPATMSTTFRYTQEELDQLADVLYELTKQTRAKLSKQDIARIGLNVVLWDHEARGDASLLSQYAARRANRR